MAWSYSGNPADSSLDEVRFLIGDTDADDQQLSNEEINFLLTDNSSDVYGAAADAARSLMAKYARRADRTVGDLKVSYSQLQKSYAELYKKYSNRAITKKMNVVAGGVFKADREAQRQNESIQQPRFVQEQFRNRREGTGLEVEGEDW